MEVYQDGVKVIGCVGYCKADEEKRNPEDIEACPVGYAYCSGDCIYYEED